MKSAWLLSSILKGTKVKLLANVDNKNHGLFKHHSYSECVKLIIFSPKHVRTMFGFFCQDASGSLFETLRESWVLDPN